MGNELPMIGKISPSLWATTSYSFVSLVIFIIVCIYGWKRLKENQDWSEVRGIKKYARWMSLVWKMKSIYLSALVHIYDICTDVGIIVDWMFQAFHERRNKDDPNANVRGLDMMGLFISSVVAFFLYRFISAGFVYEFTGKWKRAFIQFWDLEIYHAIYITHKLGREEAGNLQRWLQKFEAIFESAPQSLLQIVYIVKTGDRSWLIMSSIALSFVSVAARFTSDDRIFFVKEAERLGLKWQRRFPKNTNEQYKQIDDDDDDIDIEDDGIDKEDYERQQSASDRKGENIDFLENKEEYPLTQSERDLQQRLKDNNPDIQIRSHQPTIIKFRYVKHSSSNDKKSFTKCKIQTAKIYTKTINKIHWNTKTVDYEGRYSEYCIKGLDSATAYWLRLSFKHDKGWTQWTEKKTFKTPLFNRWKLWNYIGFNGAYLFRYSFRMCDVFSRLMILALIWCVLSGTITLLILVFEVITVVTYAQQIKKYNFFQFLVATYFSEDNRKQTVTYCFFRRIESLVYLVIVSIVILFHDRYNKDSDIDCYKAYDPSSNDEALRLCMLDAAETCDCELYNEVWTTKLLLILAWSFANLSGDVFFGAFNSMRRKFGTNERNIVNVMEKRDWEAFSEMLQFGYRMNRFDERSQRSGLSTFLDQVPSDKFQFEEIERMIELGANINDVSIKPKDKRDHDEPLKVGDNVLIRYIKVTPCEMIDQQFDDVVAKWTTTGITGGSYIQRKDRIRVDINAKNANGYTAFKVYWEKIQYVLKDKHNERSDVSYRRYWHREENEYKYEEREDHPTPEIDAEEEVLKAWFRGFYENILKWEELGADMSTMSEDGISPLLQYVEDIKNEDIKMSTIKRLCPIDGKNLEEKEEKYEVIEMENADGGYIRKKEFFVDKETRKSAFSKWYYGHDFDKKLFDVNDIKIWHKLGATDDIKKLHPLKTYLQKCDVNEQKREYIDGLIACGCSLENQEAEQFPSKNMLPVTTMIDTMFSSGKVNLDIIDYLHDEYKVPVETNGNANFEDVTNPNDYETQLTKYIRNHDALTVDNIQRLIKRGYILKREGEDAQKLVRAAVRNRKLPFDVFLFLLDAVEFDDDDDNKDNKNKEKVIFASEEYKHKKLDCAIFNSWIQFNEYITFEQIKTLIAKYRFSPYQSTNNTDCAIHYIWKNQYISFDVMHEFWMEYGVNKFGKFEEIYVGFLWYILRKKKLKTAEEIKSLERIFSEYIGRTDDVTGSSWLHFYCENDNLEMAVLKYLCTKYSNQLLIANKNGDKPLHLLCKNKSLNIDILEYFVVQLNIPMTLANESGFQPFQALHYLVDNKKITWKKKDVDIMIHKLKIDFETRRAGEVILYRLSKQSNFTIEGLIHLYDYYKHKVDLNSLKSVKEMWKDKADSGSTTILLHLMQRSLTPNQVQKLVDLIGFDITAKNNDNKTVLHVLAASNCGAHVLRAAGNLLKREYGDDFLVDIPDKQGITPFQKWLKASGEYACYYMDTFEVWEELGADITQNESDAAYNMLHHYTSGDPKLTRLSYFRKLCFDSENPWLVEEQNYTKSKKDKRRGRLAFQVPLHARPVPDNQTLFRIYINTAMYRQQPVNIKVLEYFASKKNEGVRAVLDTVDSPLWIYMKHKHIDLDVVKYMVEKLGCSVRPAPSDQIVFEYMNYLSNRDAIDWDVLDYFYNLTDATGKKMVDFKLKQKEYITLLHKYCHQLDPEEHRGQRYYNQRYYRRARRGSYSLIFSCDDFKQLIERYDLESILHEEKAANPTAAAHFYEHRANEIRPDIIKCFTELGFDINEQVNNKTPIQHYCSARSSYIMKSILRSFIEDGGANINDRIPGQQAVSMSQVVANTVSKKIFKMLVETFKVQLVNAKKRTQDVWWTFMENYGGGFPVFKKLLRIYIDQNFKPIHLFHDNNKDKDKKAQYKLYKVSIDGINIDDEKEFKLKKNKKKVKTAKKYIGRIMFVTDGRDSLFRACKAIAARDYTDGQAKEIPQKWLRPVYFEEIREQLDDIETTYKSFYEPIPGKKLARSLVIIDMETIQDIQDLLSIPRSIHKDQQDKTMNDIKLRKNNTILMKYINTNHRTDILSSDIDKMKEYDIDFEHKNDSRLNALDIYCKESKGVLDKDVVMSLIKGGCPINWPYEKKKPDEDDDDDDDEDGKKKKKKRLSISGGVLDALGFHQKREVIKGDFTPLHHYCQLDESNLKGFQVLVECGADVTLESKQNLTAVYYLLRSSDHMNEEFIKYLVNDCGINFNRQLSSGWSYFNFFLKQNSEIDSKTVIALCDIAECDPNSRDDENDTNSIKSYVKNDKRKFDFDIIKCLVELGADINEPDNDGVYPIQYALQIKYTPLSTLMKYARNMIECGGKLQHILPDDPLGIEDNKLYILQQMKDGYEMYDQTWCRIESWSWGRKKKQKIQTAVALDRFGATKLFISIVRQNLIGITEKMLIAEYPQFADINDIQEYAPSPRSVEHPHHDVIEEEEEVKEQKED